MEEEHLAVAISFNIFFYLNPKNFILGGMKSKEIPFGRDYSRLMLWNNYKFNPKINSEMRRDISFLGGIISSEIKNIQDYTTQTSSNM
ncbi:hypothetical protein C5167_020275 [Papaver somniferum]|uniref:Uncharacterized protein n=1 Tax=Papaver somniferum TaxID=3469 RepID=A0A4Y7IWH7_PAPSO|nr:hypothetical protein C5167_020275 [Papaver somniferum]